MYYRLKINSMPTIRYAHCFTRKNYTAVYANEFTAIELAYVVNGTLLVRMPCGELQIPSGSFFVFSSKLPITIISEKDVLHVHHTIQLACEHDIELVEAEKISCQEGLDSYMVLPVCMKCDAGSDHILEKLIRIIRDYSLAEKSACQIYALKSVSLFAEMAEVYKTVMERSDICVSEQQLFSSLSHRIKKYVANRVCEQFTLKDLARELDKSPNYLNTVFKSTEHITIRQYINKEKVMVIIAQMNNQRYTFKEACEAVGIPDVSYGYRLFKKVTGTTPQLYLMNSFKNWEAIGLMPDTK